MGVDLRDGSAEETPTLRPRSAVFSVPRDCPLEIRQHGSVTTRSGTGPFWWLSRGGNTRSHPEHGS